MKLIHHGLAMELADSDPRVRVIEVLLFGGTLPAPFGMPTAPAPKTPPIPPVLLVWWAALTPSDKKELTLLSQRPYPVAAMETALGLTQSKLMGQHSRQSRISRRYKAGILVKGRGRGRKHRRYCLTDDAAQWVRLLVAQDGREVQRSGV